MKLKPGDFMANLKGNTETLALVVSQGEESTEIVGTPRQIASLIETLQTMMITAADKLATEHEPRISLN